RARGRAAARRPAVESPPVAIFDRTIVRLLPAVPRPIVQKLSERYIAGPELKDARETVRRLHADGNAATIDVLGEEIRNRREAGGSGPSSTYSQTSSAAVSTPA